MSDKKDNSNDSNGGLPSYMWHSKSRGKLGSPNVKAVEPGDSNGGLPSYMWHSKSRGKLGSPNVKAADSGDSNGGLPSYMWDRKSAGKPNFVFKLLGVFFSGVFQSASAVGERYPETIQQGYEELEFLEAQQSQETAMKNEHRRLERERNGRGR